MTISLGSDSDTLSLVDASRQTAEASAEILRILRNIQLVKDSSATTTNEIERDKEKDDQERSKEIAKPQVNEITDSKESGGFFSKIWDFVGTIKSSITGLFSAKPESISPRDLFTNVSGFNISKEKPENIIQQNDKIENDSKKSPGTSDISTNLPTNFPEITLEPISQAIDKLSSVLSGSINRLSENLVTPETSNNITSLANESVTPAKILNTTPGENLAVGGFTTAKEFMVGEGSGTNPNPETAEKVTNPTGAPIQVENTKQLNASGVFLPGQMPGFAEGTSNHPKTQDIPRFDLGSLGQTISGGGTNSNLRGVFGEAIDSVRNISAILMPQWAEQIGFVSGTLKIFASVVMDTVNGFRSLTESLAYISPQISIAQAQQEVKDVFFDINSNAKMGDQLADLYNVSEDGWREIRGQLREIASGLMPTIVATLKGIMALVTAIVKLAPHDVGELGTLGVAGAVGFSLGPIAGTISLLTAGILNWLTRKEDKDDEKQTQDILAHRMDRGFINAISGLQFLNGRNFNNVGI